MTRVIAIAAAAALLLTGCMDRERDTRTQPAPDHFSGTIGAKYTALVPLVTGGRCEHGSFSIDGRQGETWELCAASVAEFESVRVGDTFAR